MTHDDRQLVAFLNGQLPDAEEQVFDEHLLDCEACWQAVQEDRAGRLVLERLRVSAPAGLADRVTASVALAGKSPAAGVGGRTGATASGASVTPVSRNAPIGRSGWWPWWPRPRWCWSRRSGRSLGWNLGTDRPATRPRSPGWWP